MLQLSGITKNYGTRQVLDNVSFTVANNRLTGFVGGNGAGKTTTMRIILGVLAADGGDITMNGQPLQTAQRRHFGYMPEERGLYPKMEVLDQVAYIARLHGYTKRDATQKATALLEELDLGARLGDKIEALSLGNQQRVQIAASLVHDPEVLILDEPFSGLDPIAVDTVAQVLQARAAKGVAVLYSSHQLDVVERLCDDLVIIAAGQVRAAGSREALREQHASHQYELATTADTGWLRSQPGIQVTAFDGGTAQFIAAEPTAADAALRTALTHGDVISFTPLRPTLAQIFKEVIQ